MELGAAPFLPGTAPESMICSTRLPPTSDDQLWLLADAGSKERWLENKNQ